MREFKLWNSSKTTFFDFAAEGIVITDINGLGIGFDVTLLNGKVVNYQKDFEDITLLANFGVSTNAYTAFNNLARFIGNNGRDKLVLEYKANKRTLYADVIAKRIPKTQKNNFGVISETLSFLRLSYWYVLENHILTSTGLVIENEIMDDLEVNTFIEGPISPSTELVLKKDEKEIIKIKTINDISGTLEILSDIKKVIIKNLATGEYSNAYNLIDKRYDTFIMVPFGKYTLTINTNQKVHVQYRRWVID